VPYKNHFRITNLPDAAQLKTVFARMSELLAEYRSRPPVPAGRVVEASARFRG
jgi:hypothetical protein